MLSIVLRAGDDFLQIEMRLAVTDSLITGSALARSDAALERDASGDLSDLRREWALRADRVPCDSMLATGHVRRQALSGTLALWQEWIQ